MKHACGSQTKTEKTEDYGGFKMSKTSTAYYNGIEEFWCQNHEQFLKFSIKDNILFIF